MSKGPSQITSSTTNPTQTAQLPYLQTGWGKAQTLLDDKPIQYTPNPTLAANNPGQVQGYSNIFGTGQSLDTALRPIANRAFSDAAGGGYGLNSSPARTLFDTFAYGTSVPQQGFRDIGSDALAAASTGQQAIGGYAPTAAGYGAQAAAGGGGFQDQLTKTARGDYLNPGSNPYLAEYVKAAQDPTTRAYQTATAPNTDAGFAKAGRYGSGALVGARGQNETNLADSLGRTAASIYAPAYEAERGRMTSAAGTGWDMQNRGLGLGITGAQTGADIAGKALGALYQGQGLASDQANRDLAGRTSGTSSLQSGYQFGKTSELDAMRAYPQLAQAQYTAANADIQAGAGQRTLAQQQIDDANNRFYGIQNAPYDSLKKYMDFIGGGSPVGGSTSSTTPNFQNPLSNALSAVTGLGSLATGISSLSSAAPAAAAALTIICTELTRQGRMPKRWWIACGRSMMNYPCREIGLRGYHVWAIPSVRHLRKHPYSLYSRTLCKIMNWRAEDIAARQGVKGARKLWRGRAVTAVLALPCLLLGLVARPDWRVVYRNEEAA